MTSLVALGRVLRDYDPQYADPISAARGEEVDVHREDGHNRGWWWCTARDGRAGWVPRELLEGPVTAGAPSRLVADYTARELAVRIGERVTVLHEWCGWLFVSNARGERGWVPADRLSRRRRRIRRRS
jgi:uncharacterized protein YgiM (DUF1202 family)